MGGGGQVWPRVLVWYRKHEIVRTALVRLGAIPPIVPPPTDCAELRGADPGRRGPDGLPARAPVPRPAPRFPHRNRSPRLSPVCSPLSCVSHNWACRRGGVGGGLDPGTTAPPPHREARGGGSTPLAGSWRRSGRAGTASSASGLRCLAPSTCTSLSFPPPAVLSPQELLNPRRNSYGPNCPNHASLFPPCESAGRDCRVFESWKQPTAIYASTQNCTAYHCLVEHNLDRNLRFGLDLT